MKSSLRLLLKDIIPTMLVFYVTLMTISQSLSVGFSTVIAIPVTYLLREGFRAWISKIKYE